MNISLLSQQTLSSVSFKIYSAKELLDLSVVEISNPETFDKAGSPNKNGLHDLRLGPSKRNERCETCKFDSFRDECPGHFGHINLPLPIFNPFLIRQAYQLLSICCFKCHKLVLHPARLVGALAQIKALDYGLDYVVGDLQNISEGLIRTFEEKSKIMSADFCTLLENKLDRYLQEKVEEAKACSNDPDIHLVKNIIEKKQRIIKGLMQAQIAKITRVCQNCAERKFSMTLSNNSQVLLQLKTVKPNAPVQVEDDDEDFEVVKNQVEEFEFDVKGKSYLSPLIARDHLRKLWQNEKNTMKLFLKILAIDENDENAMDCFFMNAIPVIPPRYRPLSFMNGRHYEAEATSLLRAAMVASENLRAIINEINKSDKTDSNFEQSKKVTSKVSTSGKKISRKKGKEKEKDGENEGAKEKDDADKKDKKEKESKEQTDKKLYSAWNRLQTLVNRIYDTEMDNLPDNKGKNKKKGGVRQVLEKKEGLFRKNMMGKRVNFAARSVISPDPYISVDEIGVPEVFATKLTYPQPVTPWNIDQLKQAVLNGPNVHPGARSVVFENGTVMNLKSDDREQRARISSLLGQHGRGTKTVNRHLISGDVLLVNRQPTLHKPSIMAHRARILQGEKTLRLHYSNCKCYNADFDGDEMNAHFPQNELARAEAYNVVSVNKQYLVPKDGSPLGGLIQDHIVGSTLLTLRGNFFNRQDYQQLVFYALSSLNKSIKILKPAIWKPVPLWSGKQVVSTVILNLIPAGKEPPSLCISAKVGSKALVQSQPKDWTLTQYFSPIQPSELCDSTVIIQKGEVLTGVIDKANIGPTPYGLIHCCYELYGGIVSNSLLSAFSKLCTLYLQIYGGISLGIEDILVEPKSDAIRRKIIKKSLSVGDEVAAQALHLDVDCDKDLLKSKLQEWHTSQDTALMKALDSCMKGKTDEINNGITTACLPDGLVKKFPNNHLQMMIQSGAKGGTVNALQISCLLGQIELEGRRVPLMMSGRTLPSFLPYDTSPRAGGFVTGRFLTGIRPQEFFFHCMAGREGLIDTAVKTSRSGYLQRCLVKHLEGLTVQYDGTVRDSDGSLIQCLYGEDGIDILKSQFLKPKAMSLLIRNRNLLAPTKDDLRKMFKFSQHGEIDKLERLIKEWERVNNTNRSVRRQGSGFQEYFDVKARQWAEANPGKFLDLMSSKEIMDSWSKVPREERHRLNFYFLPCPGPIISQFPPDANFGVMSEKLESQINNYVQNSRDCLVQTDSTDFGAEKWKGRRLISESDLREIIYTRYMKCSCDPGEAVGLLAAQSIGEPSTQMTLNTFHFAGRGDMNVTLGIPRLREILMTASPKISTPNMDLPLALNLGPSAARKAERFRRKLNAVKLSDVLENITVEERLKINQMYCSKFYHVKFKFLPYSAYKKKLHAKPATILQFIEAKFIKDILIAITRAETIQKKYNSLYDDSLHHRASKPGGETEEGEAVPSSAPPPTGDDDEGSSDDEDNAVEDDTHAVRTKARRNQELDYEEPEEEEIQANKEPDDENADEVVILGEGGDDSKKDEEQESEIVQGDSELMARLAAIKAEREDMVKVQDPHIHKYDFDSRKGEWCKVVLRFPLRNDKIDIPSIIEEEAKKAYVYRIGKVERAFLVDDRQAQERGAEYDKMIKTEGVSFLGLADFHKVFDLNRVHSNDTHAIANFYGIEAARAALSKEIANVFSVYGIEVDPRHLSLISDYMTFEGKIRGMNRMSMSGNSSPLQQMTFETTAAFLKTAVMLDLKDKLESPSARVFAGRPPRGGTGIIGLVQDGNFDYSTRKDKTNFRSPNKLVWSPYKIDKPERPNRKRKFDLSSSSASPRIAKPVNKRIKFA
ncbi:RNA polymerase I subunit RpI1 [Brevipalpus obovatus]|uniref:RNA polymerase I subunit RpI1 n=1 Tax=Brevipalpus obovatus TaxID=246614 RepID=UPI003D9E4782